MNEEIKILMFEYAIFRLIEWFRKVAPKAHIPSHFSRLASLKFLFLVSAIKVPTHSTATGTMGHTDLLDVFGNFVAMQYGPVEIDVYSAMATRRTRNYTFGNRALSGSATFEAFHALPEDLKARVDQSIRTMYQVNPNIIIYDPFQLVDVTHKWEAWQNAIFRAEWFGRSSEPMSVESIRNSHPFYA